ncbi:MAG: hypothetical protein LBH55_03315 [Mycoplasmataceae bacterium]|jgi:hypothetical protein|nr:hypothetical protein [Mycoplasmataceae bacterium]
MINQEEIKKHPLFKDLNLTDIEIDDNFFVIEGIIENDDACNASAKKCPCGGVHQKLIRNETGKLILVSYECPKYRASLYFIRQFTDNLLEQKLDKETFSEFECISQKVLYKEFLNNIKTENINKSYYIHGDVATWKTSLCVSYANEIVSKLQKSICYIFANRINSLLSYNNHESAEKNLSLIENCDVLFIDELGSTIPKFAYEKIVEIIDLRNAKNLPIVFISNFEINNLKDVINTSIESIENSDIFVKKIKKILKSNPTNTFLLGV